MKLRWLLLISILMLLSGCKEAPGSEPGTGANADSRPIFQDVETVSVDVMHSDWKFSDSTTIEPGHWEKAEELFLGPVFQKGEPAGNTSSISGEGMVFTAGSETWRVTAGTVLDAYPAGGECWPDLTIRRNGKKAKKPLHLYGSLYFADIEEGEDPFGQKVSVRQYLRQRNGTDSRRVLFHHFGIGKNEGRDGRIGGQNSVEYYYQPAADFPRLIKDGDTISLVLDMEEEDSGTAMRRIWKYRWVSDDPVSVSELAEEEDHSGNEWLCTTYPGTWDLTDICYVREERAEPAGELQVKAERKGVDGQDQWYLFAKGEESLMITIPGLKFNNRYYGGESLIREMAIFADSKSEMAGVNCSLAIGEVTYDEEDGSVKVTPEIYFKAGWPNKDAVVFNPVPHDETMSWRDDLLRGYLMMNAGMPSGKATGDKIWIVLGTMDETKAFRMFDIYEYTWTQGPVDVWTYHPPMY